jgi:hypothetical protein
MVRPVIVAICSGFIFGAQHVFSHLDFLIFDSVRNLVRRAVPVFSPCCEKVAQFGENVTFTGFDLVCNCTR